MRGGFIKRIAKAETGGQRQQEQEGMEDETGRRVAAAASGKQAGSRQSAVMRQSLTKTPRVSLPKHSSLMLLRMEQTGGKT